MNLNPFKKKEDVGTRIQNIILKIHEEYPELMLQNVSGNSSLSEPQIIKMYYELKYMESQKFRDTITKIIMLLNIFVVVLLGYVTYLKK